MDQSPAFTQLLDRGIAAEGILASWCPTMDLLALATADGQLHLHRLNWQRLWWTSPDAPITGQLEPLPMRAIQPPAHPICAAAIAAAANQNLPPFASPAALEWRPDGKQLAVGLEDGTVLLLNTEDGEVQHKAQLVPDSALVAISWTELAAASQRGGGSAANASEPAATVSSQLSGDRARRMFAPPPPAVPPAAAGLAMGYSTCGRRSTCSQAWLPEPARLAVLACASAAGDVVLCTSRLFPLALLRLPALLACPQVAVQRLATAPSLQQLSVCWRDASGGNGDGDALRLSVVSMQHVGAHAAQLYRLAAEASHVGALLEGCQQTYEAACKEWQAGMRECEDSRSRLAALMSDYGTSGEPASELQSLLATGAVGGALQQYITVTLGEAGLKKLARAVDTAVCSVHNLLTDHLQPQLEQLSFRLGELRGLALCLPWRRITGLQPEQVAAAEQLALRLMLLSEAVRRRLVQAGAQYRTFFAWLLIVLKRMQEDASDVLVGYPRSQLEAVEDFLAEQYRRDAVGPMLGASSSPSGGEGGSGGSQDGEPPSAAAAAAGSGMLELMMEVLGRQAMDQAADSTAGASSSGGRVAGSSTGNDRSSAGSSLGPLLLGLHRACLAAFGRTSDVVSPTLSLSSSFSLGPTPTALAATYLSPGSATAAAAVAWEGQPQVLLLRGAGGDTAGGDTPVCVEAALLQLPAGTAAVDVSFYKEGQLVLLLAHLAAGGAGQGTASCSLLLLPQTRLQFVQLPKELLADSDALELCQMLLKSQGSSTSGVPLPAACRQRVLPYPCVQPPLAVSISRGVGCVLAGTQHVLLYDLEEDEEEEEPEEAEEGGGQEGDAAFLSPPRRGPGTGQAFCPQPPNTPLFSFPK